MLYFTAMVLVSLLGKRHEKITTKQKKSQLAASTKNTKSYKQAKLSVLPGRVHGSYRVLIEGCSY